MVLSICKNKQFIAPPPSFHQYPQPTQVFAPFAHQTTHFPPNFSYNNLTIEWWAHPNHHSCSAGVGTSVSRRWGRWGCTTSGVYACTTTSWTTSRWWRQYTNSCCRPRARTSSWWNSRTTITTVPISSPWSRSRQNSSPYAPPPIDITSTSNTSPSRCSRCSRRPPSPSPKHKVRCGWL